MRARSLRAEPPRSSVLVFATPRTGSSLLVDLLDQQPGVEMKGEVLNQGYGFGLDPKPRPARALRHIRAAILDGNAPVRGTKLIAGQLQANRLTPHDLRTVIDPLHVIVLYRASIGEQYLSHMQARQTRRWKDPGGRPAPEDLRLTGLDTEGFDSYAANVVAQYTTAMAPPWLRDSAIVVSYEELELDPQAVLERISSIVGFEPVAARPRLHKQRSGTIADRVDDPRLAAHLQSTRLSVDRDGVRLDRLSSNETRHPPD